jgi:hypothetical protein
VQGVSSSLKPAGGKPPISSTPQSAAGGSGTKTDKAAAAVDPPPAEQDGTNGKGKPQEVPPKEVAADAADPSKKFKISNNLDSK